MAQEWFDVYPLNLKIMYGQCKAKWNVVYLCSNVPPKDWYLGASTDIRKSLDRRIHEVWRFTKDAVYLEKGSGDFPPIPDPKIRPAPSIITHTANQHNPAAWLHSESPTVTVNVEPSHPQPIRPLRKVPPIYVPDNKTTDTLKNLLTSILNMPSAPNTLASKLMAEDFI